MCGVTGFWGAAQSDRAGEIARDMALRIKHRGPDSSGEWTDPEVGIALAHRRLSIIDLSPAGHQPMTSGDGRYVVSYNGEIYNHLHLRDELERVAGRQEWRGHSDTETLLAAISHWGVPGALERLNGMFAFALWDRQERTLYLARDRMGEKPLYFGHQKGTFLFGSELKALAAHPDWAGKVDRNSLTLLLRYSSMLAPHCIYENMQQLPPAHYVSITDGGKSVSEPICYWSLEDAVADGQRNPVRGSPEELTDQLEALLTDAVSMRMASDVPLGAFLSGGVDSSTIVALMQATSERPVQTFSIGFDEAGYNEAEHAKAVAEHLGTDHTELYVRPNDALEIVPNLAEMWDEPFADSSQLPTYLVSQLARRNVTVSLSGDGGDELFCGYSRYTLAHSIWSKFGIAPKAVRRGTAAILSRMPSGALDRISESLPGRLRYPAFGDRLLKLAEVLDHQDGDAFYHSLRSHFKYPADIVLGASEPTTTLNSKDGWPEVSDFRERMMYLDAKTYLPDDILTKVDRASMAVSLESRVPLLDHRVVEFAYAVPLDMKLREGQSKWLLREVLYRHVPRHLIDRPKMGFGVPIDHWLRGPLRDWAEALLDPRLLKDQGYFDPEPLRKMWEENLSGARRWHYHLWDVLMFQAWLEKAKPDA